MPDLKISQLPVASTPLAGTELVPIVQGGVTDQTTVQAILTSAVPSGTVNGVLFLNGSKVLTTGSALTFDGTALLSTVGPFRSTVGAVDSIFGSGSFVSSTLGIGTVSNHPITFNVNLNEQMRLTSTGLGIGTNNPIQKLTVSGEAAFSRIGLNANAIDTASTAQSFVRFQTTGGDFYIGTESSVGGAFFPSSTAYAAVLYNSSATPMQFYTAGTLRATLDSSGNLGLGTSSFGTSAAGVLSIGNGTEPSTGPANTVQVYSVDLSAGNTIPAVYCEGSGVTGAGITNVTVTHKIAIKVNGTVYYLLATTNAT